MSKFKDKKVYVIVPVADALNNYAMLNASTSKNFDDVRKNDVAGAVTKYLFEATEPVDDVFSSYQWYDIDEIRIEMEKSEWQG